MTTDPRWTHRGRLDGADLHDGSAEQIARRHKVSREAVMQRRRAEKRGPIGTVVRSDGARWNALHNADLTRPTADLVREYGCTRSAVSRARKARGVTCWEGKEAKRPTAPPPTPEAEAEARIRSALTAEIASGATPWSATLTVHARLGRSLGWTPDQIRALVAR